MQLWASGTIEGGVRTDDLQEPRFTDARLRVRVGPPKIGWLRPMLETLPGCAMMAIIAPAARNASPVELAGLVVVVALMWKTNNVAFATGAGLLILFLGPAVLETLTTM